MAIWGKLYGTGPAYYTPDGPVYMRRYRQTVRFYTADGQQVGPQQRNVAPAIAYAHSMGWTSPATYQQVAAAFDEAADEGRVVVDPEEGATHRCCYAVAYGMPWTEVCGMPAVGKWHEEDNEWFCAEHINPKVD